MIHLGQSFDEFASRRRKAQTDIESALTPVVTRALDLGENTEGWSEVLAEMTKQFSLAYFEEAGERPDGLPSGTLSEALSTLRKTHRDNQPDPATVERISAWLATLILSLATEQAAVDDPEDVFLEWVSMGDTHVRPAHREVAGQVRPVGEPFDVGGVEMDHPGDSSAPPELWIGCRCTLRPTLARTASGGWGAPSEQEYQMTEWRDVSTEERKKLVDKGKALPDGSFPIANCDDLRNAIQAIGRAKDPAKAKAHIKKRAGQLNCGDVIPEGWALVEQGIPESPNQETKATSTVIVAIPPEDDEINRIGDEQKHVTLCFLGEVEDDMVDDIKAVVAQAAQIAKPMVSEVGGTAVLGPDKAKVLILDDPDLIAVRDWMLEEEPVGDLCAAADTHPNTIMHLTITYGDMPPEAEKVTEVTFDRLAVWHRDQQTEYALGGADMSETDTKEPETEAPPVPDGPDGMAMETNAVPWHGPLAPEGIKSGDGRRFTEGSLSNRPLPLPLTWQKVSDDAHKGNVTIAKIERVVKYDGRLWGTGHMISNAEADELTGLIGEFGRFGVSVDADSAVFDLNEDDDCLDYTEARVSSACVVPIPAFAEAWVALGEWPEEIETAWQEANGIAGDEALVASVTALAERAEFKDLAPGKTEDGPGWLTHPVDTDRLRDYWVRGPGAAKIGWGTPGDFNRCRVNVAEYVKPQYLNGYCANRHYDALGFWPGRPVAGDTETFAYEKLGLQQTERAEVLSMVASGVLTAPHEWFADPQFAPNDGRMVQDRDGNWACPLTITDEGEVYAHIASWNSCHLDSAAYGEMCVTPPHSQTGYAYFLHGAVHLDNGERCPVGPLTIGGGHANGRLGMRAALEHYDNASTAWADVAVGEDDYGIWCHGWVRPGTTQEMLTAAAATPLSGDWRTAPQGSLEMIAAHGVNTPGYLIPRIQIAAANGEQVSLVAAGVVEPSEDPAPTVALADLDVEALSEQIAAALVGINARRAEMAALAAEITEED